MIYSFPSLWIGEDGREERAGKRWKAMKSVPEWALGFALFQMSILLGDLQPSWQAVPVSTDWSPEFVSLLSPK